MSKVAELPQNTVGYGPGCKAALESCGIAPAGHKVLVKADEYMKSYEGIIEIPAPIKDKSQHAQTAGVVVAVGLTAYQDKDFGNGTLWCKPGDRVGFARYGGLAIKGNDGSPYRILNDADILCHLANDVSFDKESTY
jgi:co-chaperonin GroES (HSP10)